MQVVRIKKNVPSRSYRRLKKKDSKRSFGIQVSSQVQTVKYKQVSALLAYSRVCGAQHWSQLLSLSSFSQPFPAVHWVISTLSRSFSSLWKHLPSPPVGVWLTSSLVSSSCTRAHFNCTYTPHSSEHHHHVCHKRRGPNITITFYRFPSSKTDPTTVA